MPKSVADAEPRIVTLLRSLHGEYVQQGQHSFEGRYLAPGVAAREITKILTEWHESEDVSKLISSCGIKKVGRGARRKQSSVRREWDIANAYANAALQRNARGYLEKFAALNSIDEREMQRAWKRHRGRVLETWRGNLKHPILKQYAERILAAFESSEGRSKRLR